MTVRITSKPPVIQRPGSVTEQGPDRREKPVVDERRGRGDRDESHRRKNGSKGSRDGTGLDEFA